jgi:hypothetical protein
MVNADWLRSAKNHPGCLGGASAGGDWTQAHLFRSEQYNFSWPEMSWLIFGFWGKGLGR